MLSRRVMMFNNINYLKKGNEKQKRAYEAIEVLGVMEQLSEYDPTLCGTLPIEIDIADSDLDIIMEVHDLQQFEKAITELYHDKENFQIKRRIMRGIPVVKANFLFFGFEFELFGQPQPVEKQNAYLHMIIEHALIMESPHVKADVITLKQQGFKTEAAFCKVLGLDLEDPYESLLTYGKKRGFI